MGYAVLTVVGFLAGAALVYFLLILREAILRRAQEQVASHAAANRAATAEIAAARKAATEELAAHRTRIAAETQASAAEIAAARKSLTVELAARRSQQTAASQKAAAEIAAAREAVDHEIAAAREAFAVELNSRRSQQTAASQAAAAEIAARREAVDQEIAAARQSLGKEVAATRESVAEELAKQRRELADDTARQRQYLATQVAALNAARQEFSNRVVKYDELVKENGLVKRDLRTMYQQWRKTQLDQQQLGEKQGEIDSRIQTLGLAYMRDQQKWITSSLNPNNLAACKQRLLDAVGKARGMGLNIDADEEARLLAALTSEYERVVRAALEREEQARIKAQIREEQKREKEIQRAIEQADREKALVEAALAKALAAAAGQHSAEVEQLQSRLAEAEAKAQRAVSQAQLTKSGFVYVISNIGSFGDGVFKIGMTRRLEPQERIDELGDASVPFPFDVHMMISTNDAPKLENALHRAFRTRRVNRVNLRKEFFRVNLSEVVEVVKTNHGEVAYQADPEALQYRNSLQTSAEDLERLDEIFEDEEAQEPAGISEVD